MLTKTKKPSARGKARIRKQTKPVLSKAEQNWVDKCEAELDRLQKAVKNSSGSPREKAERLRKAFIIASSQVKSVKK